MKRLGDVTRPAYSASVEALRDPVCTINCSPNGDRPAYLASALEAFTTNQCPNLDPEFRLT